MIAPKDALPSPNGWVKTGQRENWLWRLRQRIAAAEVARTPAEAKQNGDTPDRENTYLLAQQDPFSEYGVRKD